MAKIDDIEIPTLLFDQQASDPATPGTDLWRLFFKSGGLYAIDDAGTVVGPFAASVTDLPDLAALDPLGGNACVNAQAISTSTNICQYRPVWIPKACEITGIRVNIGTSSGNISVAVYDDDSGAPDTRLATSGAVASPGTGWRTINLTAPLSITTPGTYWFALSCDNNTATFYTVNLAGTSAPFAQFESSAHPAPASATVGGASRGSVMIGILTGGV